MADGDERYFRNPHLTDSACSLSFDGTTGKPEVSDDVKVKLQEAIHSCLPLLESANLGNRDHSVYTGVTGIALLLHHIATRLCSDSPDKSHAYLRRAIQLLDPVLLQPDTHRLTFLCGAGGPLALGAVIYNQLGDTDKAVECVAKLKQLFTEQKASFAQLPSELLFGHCGYLYALLFVQAHIPKSVDEPLIAEVATMVLDIGERQREAKYSSPLMYTWHGKHYLGAAHGLAGILTLLLQVDLATLKPRIDPLVQRATDFLLSVCFSSGNLPSSLESSHADRLIHWCHGAPGFVHLLAHAYRRYGDQRYLDGAVQCGEVVWKRGLLRKGYGLCHGAAGNAYTFLQLYKLTGKTLYFSRAVHFAKWCLSSDQRETRIPDRPNSLFEGLAGIIYFYTDLLIGADKAIFPALELPR